MMVLTRHKQSTYEVVLESFPSLILNGIKEISWWIALSIFQ